MPIPCSPSGYALKTRFHTLLAQQDRAAFDPWLQEAETSDLPSFQTVARSFRQDYAAIIAALTTPWSTGQCEGQICRVKLLKRLGYGRAKLDVLAQRILHRTVAAPAVCWERASDPAPSRRLSAYGHKPGPATTGGRVGPIHTMRHQKRG